MAERSDKAALKAELATPKARFEVARRNLVGTLKERKKQVARAVKELGKLQEERDAREQEVRLAAEREITHLCEAAADLTRIFASEDEARRYFAVVDRAKIEENEFNLNLPRYVDTFEPEKVLPLAEASAQLAVASEAAEKAQAALRKLLTGVSGERA